MQVADTLGDTNIATWVNKLAAVVASTHPSQSTHMEDLLCSLLRLPSHLLHLVITSYLSHNDFSVALTNLPSELHPAIISAATVSGRLSFSHSIARTVLLTLRHVAVPGPGLVHIEIVCRRNSQNQALCSRWPTAALLALAAAAHPSLTSLSLSGEAPIPPQWLRTFSGCLAPRALPNLASLTLHTHAHPGGCAEVAACLRLLPSLASLNVSFHTAPKPAAARLSLAAYTSLAATAVSLPHLQRLSYSDGVSCVDKSSFNDCPFKRTAQASCAHSLLSVLSAPALKRLGLQLFTCLPMQPLLQQIARFTSLEAIEITGHLPPLSHTLQRSIAATAQLPRLSHLHVTGNFPISQFPLGSALAMLGPATLTSLTLTHDLDGGGPPESADPTDAEAAPVLESSGQSACYAFFDVLGRCTALQDLSLSALPAAWCSASMFSGKLLMSVLKHLQKLTLLWLQGYTDQDLPLDGEQLGRAISELTQLHSLSLTGPYAKVVGPSQPLIDACSQLRHLTWLDLSMDGIRHTQVTALLPHLPSLQMLSCAAPQDMSESDYRELRQLELQYPHVKLEFM